VAVAGALYFLHLAGKENGDYNPMPSILALVALVWFIVVWIVYAAYLLGSMR
jgi:heme/copper-type cytochrome/quinol oxidase subunit 4